MSQNWGSFVTWVLSFMDLEADGFDYAYIVNVRQGVITLTCKSCGREYGDIAKRKREIIRHRLSCRELRKAG